MASKIKTTEYSYSSAKIRALENSLLSAERLRTLMDCSTFSDVMGKLSEYGITLVSTNDELDCEATLQKLYTDACELVRAEVPESEGLSFLRYPYDCNNLKACIKCGIRKISPDSMLYDCGVCTADEAKAAVGGGFAGFPQNMQGAIDEAARAYAKSKNPQLIDLILDRACYADMLECAAGSGCEFFIKLVKTKIDLTNIITSVRLMRMNMGASGRALLEGSLLDGGTYPASFYTELYESGEAKLCEALAYSDYWKFISCIVENPDSLSGVEKYADNFYIDVVKSTKLIAFGPEIAAAYLVAVEYEVKNLRIILDGKKTGKSAEAIGERLRYSYV